MKYLFCLLLCGLLFFQVNGQIIKNNLFEKKFSENKISEMGIDSDGFINPKDIIQNKLHKNSSTKFMVQKIVTDLDTTEYTYDERGNVLKVHNADGTEFFYSYDSNNNILTKEWSDRKFIYTYGQDYYSYITMTLINSQWTIYSLDSIYYSNNGQIKTHLSELYTNGQWVPKHMIEDIYNSNNKIQQRTLFFDNGNGLINYQKMSYNYSNENDYIETIEFWENSQWANHYRLTYSFNGNQDQIFYQAEIWINDQWNNDERRTSTYDNNNNLILVTADTWNGNQWGLTSRFVQTFDNQNRILTYTGEYTNNNNEFAIQDKSEYSYSQNLRTTLIYHRYANLDFIAKIKDSYDSNLNLLESLRYEPIVGNDSTGSNLKIVTDQKYEYDNYGNCIKYTGYGNILSPGVNLTYNNRQDFIYIAGNNAEITYVQITGVNDNSLSPASFTLSQNYPNPFNPSTTIKYSIPNSSIVSLKVYDILGNEVKTLVNEFKQSGSYSINFTASGLSSGVYIYKISAGDFISARKMILLK